MSLVELLSLVPPGETRLFPRKAPAPHSERFFGVHMAWEYAPARLNWHNEPELGEGPRRTGLFSEGVSVTTLERPQLTFDGPGCDLIDFYTPKSGMAALLSMRLFEMIEALDPGSIESIPAMVRAMGAIVPYRFTMPTRSLYAVDVNHTDVLVKDTDYAGEWLRSVEFPSGIAFRNDLPAGAYSFAERCLPFWYWSRELIDAFRDAGMRGIYTHTETAAGSKTVDRI